jgi:hypothetical protein
VADRARSSSSSVFSSLIVSAASRLLFIDKRRRGGFNLLSILGFFYPDKGHSESGNITDKQDNVCAKLHIAWEGGAISSQTLQSEAA